MRCKDAFLMQCLVLKLKSSKAYRHIQQECMLPLPSKSTLRSLLSSSECKFGFNDLALSCIKEALTGLPLSHRGGTINHDEISIKKDIAFYKETVEHHKIVDFGDDLTAKYQNGVADYVLVFIFHPYRAKWIQPFACIASKGAATGEILFELILKATVTLFNHCAILKGVVSDCVHTNKPTKCLELMECKKFSIPHPLAPNEKNTSSLTCRIFLNVSGIMYIHIDMCRLAT